jgi:hypothetical protein
MIVPFVVQSRRKLSSQSTVEHFYAIDQCTQAIKSNNQPNFVVAKVHLSIRLIWLACSDIICPRPSSRYVTRALGGATKIAWLIALSACPVIARFVLFRTLYCPL